jgi:hypothetical protein
METLKLCRTIYGKQLILLPEDSRRKELRKLGRKKKVRVLKPRMKRTIFPRREVTEVPRRRKLVLVSRYLKANPELKRTKFPKGTRRIKRVSSLTVFY